MIEELIEILNSFDFEEFGSARLNSISRLEPASIELQLQVHIHTDDRQLVTWRVECTSDVFSSLVDPFGDCDISFLPIHPTLWPYHETGCAVTFCGRPNDPVRAFARMSEVQFEMLGDWYDPMHFFNRQMGNSAVKLLETGFGSLAFGPERLMESFVAMLKDEGVSAACGPRQAPTVPDAKVLLLGRKSFIVAREFSAAKLS